MHIRGEKRGSVASRSEYIGLTSGPVLSFCSNMKTKKLVKYGFNCNGRNGLGTLRKYYRNFLHSVTENIRDTEGENPSVVKTKKIPVMFYPTLASPHGPIQNNEQKEHLKKESTQYVNVHESR